MRINAKNFYNRKVEKCMPHFTKTTLKGALIQPENIEKWIYENCHGRYSITRDVIYEGDQSRSITVIGFENPGDLTLFALSGKAQINQI